MFKIKNNKGFTMVELLAAVTILGILATIAIVSVTNTMKKSHKEYDEKQNKLFTTAAQTYFTDNRSELPKKLLTTNTVTLKKLIDENYIEEIVDYKKKAYDKEKSVATVKKTGAGKYMYYSTLVREDGKSISDAPDTNNKTGTVKITINNPNLVNTDMKISLTEYGKTIYYVNKEITIPVGLTGTGGISSYQYRIDKLSTVSSSAGKKYKVSGEIAVDAPSFSDTLTINAKDFANGIYRLSINAYGYQAEGSTKDASYIIVIDKTKPKCTIEVSGTKGNQVEGLNNVYWYKQGNLSAIMKITEKNKYKYTLGFDEMQYNIDYKTDNTKEEEQLPITQNIVDKNVYGYVKDKAGNVGECKTENPIYYDNTVPTCKINISGGDYHSNTTWYWDDISLSLARYDDNGTNQSEQGENESGVYQYDMSTNNFAANQIITYTNSSNKTQSNETPGIIWYGYLKDKAGNQGKCESATLKLDKSNPYCTYEGESTTWTNGDRTITAKCADSISGCSSSSSNTWDSNTSTASFPNFSITDGAGRTSSCNKTVNVYIDKTAPSCSVEKICYSSGSNGWCNSSDGGNVEAKCKDNTNTTGLNSGCSGKGYLYTDGATNTNDNGEKNGEWADAYYFSRDVKAQGSSGVHWYVYDKAGNSKDCGRYEVKVDYTAPSLEVIAKNSNETLRKQCPNPSGTSATCKLEYFNNYGAYLKASDGVSGLWYWGAKAKYDSGGSCPGSYTWGFTGSAVCTTAGTGNIKRCYKVKDMAGNVSDSQCTCEKSNKIFEKNAGCVD